MAHNGGRVVEKQDEHTSSALANVSPATPPPTMMTRKRSVLDIMHSCLLFNQLESVGTGSKKSADCAVRRVEHPDANSCDRRKRAEIAGRMSANTSALMDARRRTYQASMTGGGKTSSAVSPQHAVKPPIPRSNGLENTYRSTRHTCCAQQRLGSPSSRRALPPWHHSFAKIRTSQSGH